MKSANDFAIVWSSWILKSWIRNLAPSSYHAWWTSDLLHSKIIITGNKSIFICCHLVILTSVAQDAHIGIGQSGINKHAGFSDFNEGLIIRERIKWSCKNIFYDTKFIQNTKRLCSNIRIRIIQYLSLSCMAARWPYTTQNMVQPVYYSPVHTQQNSWKPCIILIVILLHQSV